MIFLGVNVSDSLLPKRCSMLYSLALFESCLSTFRCNSEVSNSRLDDMSYYHGCSLDYSNATRVLQAGKISL